jgi:hypothetical protein
MAHYPHFPRESDPHYVDFHAFHKKYRPDARCEFASHATLDGDAPTVRQDATPHRLIGPGQLRAECDIKSPMAPQNHRVQSSERRRPSSPREGLPRNFKPQRGRRLGRSATKKRSAITSRSRTTPSPTTAVREQLRTNSLFSEYVRLRPTRRGSLPRTYPTINTTFSVTTPIAVHGRSTRWTAGFADQNGSNDQFIGRDAGSTYNNSPPAN